MHRRFPRIVDETSYAFPVARIRVLETRLLDEQRLERMVDAAGADEVYKILSETEYAEAIAACGTVLEFEDMLAAELKRVYVYVGKFVPERAVLDALLIRFDFHNLKVLVKEQLLEETAESALFAIGAEPLGALRRGVSEVLKGQDNQGDSPGSMAAVYREAVREASRVYAVTRDARDIDITIDGKMFESGLAFAGESRSHMLIALWQAWVDLANLKSFTRAASQGFLPEYFGKVLLAGGTVPARALLEVYSPSVDAVDSLIAFCANTAYATLTATGLKDFKVSRSYALFEKLIDNYPLGVLRASKTISLGSEPIVTYLLAKENEIRNLRIILVGKTNRLPADAIRERLRDAYV